MRLIKKTCSKCKKEKELSEFVKQKNGKNGLSSWCCNCKSENHEKWREKRKLTGYKDTHYKEYRKNPINRKKFNTHMLVYQAKKKGLLVSKPCVVCGDKKSQAHHEDYNKPLDVIWLCQSCHKRLHMKYFTLKDV